MILHGRTIEQTIDRQERGAFYKELVVTGGKVPLAMVRKRATELGGTRAPVLLVHGALDGRIPFAESGRAEQSLIARGARVERLDRPQMAHTIDGESLAAAVAFLGRSLETARGRSPISR